LFLDPSSKTQI